MTKLRRNLVANYLGQGWAAVMGLAFIPLYIRYLGIEAYGLIGLFAVLQAWLALLDMGMTPTLSREMSRFTAGAHTVQSIRDLLRSMEVVCLSVATLISLAVWLGSTWLASDWLRPGDLPVITVAHAIALMGAVIALRLVEAFYRGAIFGLQRQVLFNVINASLATLRGLGAVVVLILVSSTIEAFFLWQGVLSLLSVTIYSAVVYRALPPLARKARFSRHALGRVWRFAAGAIATTFLALLLTQVDKLLLSRLLDLRSFGYYALAGVVAGALYYFTGPITQAYYPRLTELVTRGDELGMTVAYHRGAQMVSVLVGSAAMMLLLFGEQLVALWTGDPSLAAKISCLVTLLALGTLLNTLMHMPYMLQLANGWSSFAAKVNVVAVAVLAPGILWATPRYGAVGAAWVWVVLNGGYIVIAIHFMHRRLLPNEKWNWYGKDLGLPLAAAALVAGLFRYFQPEMLSKLAELLWLISVGLITTAAATFAAPEIRKLAVQQLQKG